MKIHEILVPLLTSLPKWYKNATEGKEDVRKVNTGLFPYRTQYRHKKSQGKLIIIIIIIIIITIIIIIIIIIIFIEETFSRTCGFRKGPQRLILINRTKNMKFMKHLS